MAGVAGVFFPALSVVWLASTVHGLFTDEAPLSTLGQCPLLGGPAPPQRPVPVWAYGVGHVLPGLAFVAVGVAIALVVSPYERLVGRSEQLRAFAVTFYALSASAPMLSPLHKAFGERSVGRMYFDAREHGVGWLALTLLLQLAVTETWLYWIHRLMHTRYLYKHIHKVHHRFVPSFTLAASAFHPLDIAALTCGSFVLPLCVPVHAGVVQAIMMANLIWTMLQHSAGRGEWGGGVLTDSNLHNIHHDFGRRPRNCGSLTCFWDHIAGTYEPRPPPWAARIKIGEPSHWTRSPSRKST